MLFEKLLGSVRARPVVLVALAVSCSLETVVDVGFCPAQEQFEAVRQGISQFIPSGPVLDSPEVAPLLERISSFQATEGVPPDILIYYELIETYGGLTGTQQSVVQAKVNGLQSALLSIEDLVDLLEAKRDSLVGFDCRYLLRDSEFPQRRFALEGTKVFNRKADKIRGSQLVSYDGEAFRTLVYRDGSDAQPFGTVTADGPLSSLFEPSIPLCRMMLADVRLTGTPLMLYDLAAYLGQSSAIVYQRTHQVNGVECILVSNGVADIYLAIEHNFAVVRLDNFVNEFAEEPDGNGLKAIRRRTQTHKTSMQDFIDYGNGLWMPSVIEFEMYNPENSPLAASYSESVRISEIDVNPVFPEGFFSDVFPNRAVVQDDVLSLAYTQGQKSSLGQMVKQQVGMKRSHTLLFINLFVLAIVVGLFVFRRLRTPRSRHDETS